MISVRKMEPADLGEVIGMLRDFAAYENLSEYCTVTAELLYEALFGEIPVAEGIVALNTENVLSGYAIFYPAFSTFRGERGLYLEDIYVKPEQQGNGMGLMMLKEIARSASRRGYERIDFQVLDWNTPAIEFYRRFGAVSNDEETHFKFSGDAFSELVS